MLLPLLAVLAFQDPGPVYNGRSRQLDVRPPRIDTQITIDGVLDEPVWRRAARLTGFSQYQPVDSRPAEEETEVLVWYGPDAIYFGIRAREAHGDVVRATSANRDNIGSEDQIQILLDTYNDHRVAFVFGVNPLGVQQDGTRSDQFSGGAGGGSTTGGGVGVNFLDGNVDLNPDYVYESKGRLVPGGYEVEVRIPFKSLRYRDGDEQTWSLNVLRKIQHTGAQDSWTPAVRASASFLIQSGTLSGMHDLHRGLVLELTPTTTARADGTPDTATGRWHYSGSGDVGGDVRWGITQSLTLNGTVNPDFSQVEADIGQVTLNQRFELFYPEKRPFFLDGLERFDTPSRLIYTRRIANPDGGLKLAGKMNGLDIATLTAVDVDPAGNRAAVSALRLRRDLASNSTLGFVGTDREDGSNFGRLLGVDAHIVHTQIYFVELQAVQSWTRQDSTNTNGSLLQAVWDRTGRNWGFHYTIQAIAPDFNAAVGFVNRTGIVSFDTHNRLTGYGSPGSPVQTYGSFFSFGRIWDYSSLHTGPIEGGESASPSVTFLGNWQLSGNFARAFYSFRSSDYAGYQLQCVLCLPPFGTVPFTVPGMENNDFTGSLSVTTPAFRLYTATASIGAGAVPIFREAAPGRMLQLAATLDVRPSNALRLSFHTSSLTIHRQRDGSRFSDEVIPRLKIEYQLSRAIFFRFVGQYTALEQAALVDRTGNPILVNGVLQGPSTQNELRVDWLFSYRPSPGTLIYLGYGSTLEEPQAFRFRQLGRTADGFFGKVSYLFRL
jgi:hypothetical protein